jgi:hypothetical protein
VFGHWRRVAFELQPPGIESLRKESSLMNVEKVIRRVDRRRVGVK